MNRTTVQIDWQLPLIEKDDELLFIGSCFSDEIGKQLAKYGFKALSNPFGVVFHPAAIFNLLQRCINNSRFTEDDFFEFDDYWFCFDLHSDLAARTLSEAKEVANEALDAVQRKLGQSTYLFLTLGSAWGYVNKGKVVANCHRQPQNEFNKKISSQKELFSLGKETLEALKIKYPNLNVVCTVSPVRHVKDSLTGNSVSKSLLRVLCFELKESNLASYFPSYEIAMDELRDYSFFGPDGVHLNSEGIEVVFKKFLKSCFSENGLTFLETMKALILKFNHQPRLEYSKSNFLFLKKLSEEIKSLPVDIQGFFRLEIEIVNDQIINWPKN